jgi:hypothetical protein
LLKTDIYDVQDVKAIDWELDVDPPPPALGDCYSLRGFTVSQYEKAKQILPHHVGNTAFKPTHQDPAAPTNWPPCV